MSTAAASRILLSLPTAALLTALARCQEATAPPQHPPLAADRATGAAAVAVDDAKKWLGTLASAEFEGRGTGQEGFQRAARYVGEHFAALGLEPAGDDGTWFQSLRWQRSKPDLDATKVTFRHGEKEVVVPGARLSGQISKSLSARGKVVVVPDGANDAIADADLAGKVVIVLLPRYEHTAENQLRRRGRRAPYPSRTMQALQGKNAAAVLFAQAEAVTTPLSGTAGPQGGNRAARGAQLFPTVVAFGGEDLTGVLALAGADAAPTDDKLHPFDVDAEVEVHVTDEVAPACNVVAIARGSDAQLANEYVVVGSHLDHLGKQGERWFPGADDDGSGTTGVMAVAHMLAKNTARPRRSVLFVCFCGEEMGLLGSDFFVRHSPIPLASIVAELQMDMIGRCEEEASDGGRRVNVGETADQNRNSLHLVGTQKLAPTLHELCLAKNGTAGFDLEWDEEGMFSRSDHANFGKMGVPMAFFFTGLHADYHQVTDTPDKIDYDKLLRVATYVYDIAFELAQQEARPTVDAELWDRYRGKSARQPAAPLTRPAQGR